MGKKYSIGAELKPARGICQLFMVVVIGMLLSSCLVWESEETTIELNDNGSGRISVRIGPIGSDGSDKEKMQLDLADLIYGYLKNPSLGQPSVQNLTHEIAINDNELYCDFKGNFNSLEAIASLTDMVISHSDIQHPLGSDEIVVRTNGTVSSSNGTMFTDSEGKKRIAWPRGTKVFKYKVRQADESDFLRPSYKPSMSLAALFLDFDKNQEKYKNLYLNFRTETAESTMAEKDYSAAWLNWQSVLQTDLDNKKAKDELERLYFVPFLNLAEGAPFPELDIAKVFLLATDSPVMSGFSELQKELSKLASNSDYSANGENLQNLIILLDRKISHTPTPEDMFLVAKLEYLNHYPHKSYARFKEAYRKYPDDYRIFAGYCKTRLTSMPREAEFLLHDIDKFLAMVEMNDPVELIFAKGVALFMTRKSGAAARAFATLQSRLFPDRTLAEFLKSYE